MTTFRGFPTAAAAATLFLISACANAGTSPIAGSAPSSSAPPAAGSADDLLLRVEQVGGFVAPSMRSGRLPQISIYADGRVITEGPVPAIYPGPALPNLQVVMIDPEQARALAEKSAAAGVTEGTDFGQPGVADVPSTQVTAVTAAGRHTVAAEALNEARANDSALTAAQQAARTKLKAYLDDVNKITLTKIAPVQYKPEIIAAVVTPYVATDDAVRPETIEWPGAALPGEPLAEGAELTCVTATGEQGDTVLAAAAKAKTNTAWGHGGNTWSIRFRPLLPDETGCADLKAGQ
ncbi:hypothetical protein [Winogradskya consettensis]|uniref:hypothetical protein n=1 Tax=Winogradskya consettensis TaxID=113560 RepID=UPI001BB3EE09|nr:hypothetical protein [Actinoplanes consettensis]